MTEILELVLDKDNKVVVHQHGATITSWVANSEEVLFVSEKSHFDKVKPIRGGIPVVFPNFGPWSENRPQHGFARTKKWSIKEPINQLQDSVTLTLGLEDDEETRKLWNYKFQLSYKLTLKHNSFKTELIVHNKDSVEFDFTSLLHTYFKLDSVDNAKVLGLNGVNYLDKVQDGKNFQETDEFIQIKAETDRVYYDTQSEHLLDTGNSNKLKIKIKKENFPDTVVWNPWINKAKAMSDFGDEEYRIMICVEVGYVKNRCVLKSNETYSMNQELILQ